MGALTMGPSQGRATSSTRSWGERLGLEVAPVRVIDDPEQRREHPRRDLDCSGVVAGDEAPRFVDIELGTVPPASERMSHEQDPELVSPLHDVMIQNSLRVGCAPIPHEGFVQTGERTVAGQIGEHHGGTVDGRAVVAVPGQKLAQGDGLTVRNRDAVDRAAEGHPAPNPDPRRHAR